MGKIKNIVIDTMNETVDLTRDELINLAKTKNNVLKITDELFEFMSDNQLVSNIAEKNLLIISKSIK
jgi:hypothetical protein